MTESLAERLAARAKNGHRFIGGLHRGDCREWLRAMPSGSVHAVVTDPPYELGFMGKTWDASGIAYDPVVWGEVLRILKPGGHCLVFGGTRTYHRVTVALEDAGFEIRDSIAAWVYGSGFPKSLDVSKAIDKSVGAERAVIRRAVGAGSTNTASLGEFAPIYDLTAPATDAAAEWAGWGTALKPAWEPIIVARKPPAGTVAANVLEHATGGLNIDATRVAGVVPQVTQGVTRAAVDGAAICGAGRGFGSSPQQSNPHDGGRWPANVVLAHHPECVDGGACHADCWVATLDAQAPATGSILKPGRVYQSRVKDHDVYGKRTAHTSQGVDGLGGASRFFPTFRYQAKAPTRERPVHEHDDGRRVAHPTVKPVDLIRWLVRLVTPPGGVVADPFLGSGTTAEAAAAEGFRWCGAEREPDYWQLIEQRADRAAEQAARKPA